MLRVKVLPDVLNQAVGDGINASLLMSTEGALLGAAGTLDNIDPNVVSAIASHAWSEYIQAGKELNSENELQCLLAELENGRLAVAAIGDTEFLYCAFSHGTAPSGLMKAKVEFMTEYLSSTLHNINAQ